tara:strand:+ start:2819 stop:3109 length:291 start_codon:yes stop_codon:yes gene_type:complete
MAWVRVKVKTDKTEYIGFQRGDEFSVPFASDLKVGDSFKVGSKEHKILSVEDIAQRGEELLVETKEISIGKNSTKPQTRGIKPQIGKDDMESESNA